MSYMPLGYGGNAGADNSPEAIKKRAAADQLLKDSMPKTAAPVTNYDPTAPVGGFPIGYNGNPESGSGFTNPQWTDIVQAHNAGDTQVYTQPDTTTGAGPNVTTTPKIGPGTTNAGAGAGAGAPAPTGPSLDDIYGMIDKMEYKTTPYAGNWDTMAGDLGATNKLQYDQTATNLGYQQKIQEQAAKDLISGRGLGRSSIAASYIAKPGEQTARSLGELSNTQAQEMSKAKTGFDTKVADYTTGENQAANQFGINKLLLKYQAAVDQHNFDQQAVLSKDLADKGINADKEIADKGTAAAKNQSWLNGIIKTIFR
jgi:hypothetical protein